MWQYSVKLSSAAGCRRCKKQRLSNWWRVLLLALSLLPLGMEGMTCRWSRRRMLASASLEERDGRQLERRILPLPSLNSSKKWYSCTVTGITTGCQCSSSTSFTKTWQCSPTNWSTPSTLASPSRHCLTEPTWPSTTFSSLPFPSSSLPSLPRTRRHRGYSPSLIFTGWSLATHCWAAESSSSGSSTGSGIQLQSILDGFSAGRGLSTTPPLETRWWDSPALAFASTLLLSC